jgi:hypothetical protein
MDFTIRIVYLKDSDQAQVQQLCRRFKDYRKVSFTPRVCLSDNRQTGRVKTKRLGGGLFYKHYQTIPKISISNSSNTLREIPGLTLAEP